MARDEFEARELEARFLGFLAEKREPGKKIETKEKPGETAEQYNERLYKNTQKCLKAGSCYVG